MRKTFKRVLSTALAGLMLASVATVGVSANNGERGQLTFQEAWDQQWKAQLGVETIDTVKYLLYMPEDWKNEYNDYYDGKSLDSCMAGIYWWGGSCNPDDCSVNKKAGWPGYAVITQDPDCPSVFIADVPTDVGTIVWNNMVDGGMDNTLPCYTKAYQSNDATVNGYTPNTDTYGFYPDGLDSMKDMIFVINPNETTISPSSQKTSYVGEWFYYYGKGEYGTAKTREEAKKVYSNGEFPAPQLTIDKAEVKTGVGSSVDVKASEITASAKAEDESIVKVESKGDGLFTLTTLKAGTTNVVFENINPVTKETDVVKLPVTVNDITFEQTSVTMKVGETAYNMGIGLGANAVVTYSTDGVVTYDPYAGEIVAKKAGKTTVTCEQGGQKYSFEVTVTAPVVKTPKLNKTSAKIAAGKTVKLSVSNATSVTYTSSKASVARVNKKTGVVTGLKSGKAVITAKAGGKTLKCTVNVTSNPKVASKNVKVSVKKTKTVKITGAASKADVKVSKCKYAKITVAKNKLTIKGTKKGNQKVTVNVNGVKFTIKLTVKK